MRRGDLVTVALQGSHCKPRPALVIQADLLVDTSHVIVLLLTSEQRDAPLLRVEIPASEGTGLRETSWAMLDRITTAPRAKIGGVIGRADAPAMQTINRLLALVLGLAD
jgi:mRNA interferase MazF